MNLLNLYHRLPPSMRSVAATMRGLYLRRWRFGPQTEQLVAEALARESWSAEQWQRWQAEQLAHQLNRAAVQVPYYRDYWQAQRRVGSRRSWELLENWPLLPKSVVREQPLAFVADDVSVGQLFKESTGGTTGTPLTLYFSQQALQAWFALFEARTRRWHGVSIRDHWAILGGQLVVPFEQQTPPYWVRNYALNQLYLSTNHLAPRTAADYVGALHDYRPTHLIVYPSSATVLAHAMLAQQLTPPPMKVIFSNSEVLLDSQRETIEAAFGCRVVNTYGMAEAVCAASEDTAGQLYLWPEAGKVELFDEAFESPVAAGETGNVVTTGLLNEAMPLIRYQVGDRMALATDSHESATGRNRLPRVRALEGRSNDLIVTPDGRKVFWLNPVFYGLPIVESQMVQDRPDHLHINYVPTAAFEEATKVEIIGRLQQRLGTEMQITFSELEKLPRTRSGKLRAIISNIDHE